MFKKILLVLAMVLPLIAGAQTIKIGLVDAQALMQDLPAYKTAVASVESKAKKFDDEYQKLLKEGDAKIEEFKALPADTPDALRERRAQELQSFQQKLNEFEQMAQQEIQKAQSEAFAPVYQEIQNAIQAVGKEGGYTIIQEKAAVLYFGAPAEDITPLVKARLGVK